MWAFRWIACKGVNKMYCVQFPLPKSCLLAFVKDASVPLVLLAFRVGLFFVFLVWVWGSPPPPHPLPCSFSFLFLLFFSFFLSFFFSLFSSFFFLSVFSVLVFLSFLCSLFLCLSGGIFSFLLPYFVVYFVDLCQLSTSLLVFPQISWICMPRIAKIATLDGKTLSRWSMIWKYRQIHNKRLSCLCSSTWILPFKIMFSIPFPVLVPNLGFLSLQAHVNKFLSCDSSPSWLLLFQVYVNKFQQSSCWMPSQYRVNFSSQAIPSVWLFLCR